MDEIIIAVWGIAFLLTLLSCVPYTIWVIYTAVKQRWRRVGLQVLIPFVAFVLLVGISALVNMGSYGRYLEGLFDSEVKLGDPIFEYDSERAFNGDGYSISVYELPSSIRARFESVDQRLLSDFPKHPSYRDDWSFERWRRAPFDPQFEDYLDFALSSYDSGRESGLLDQFGLIREALSSDQAYYAFFYYSPSDYVGNVDLFIVDLDGDRLYLINHNT